MRSSISWFLFLIGIGVYSAANAQVEFEEIALQSGINHMHLGTFRMGGGIAVLDFDNDGWEDVYMTGGEDPDKLYRNLGNGQFADVSSQAGIIGITSGHDSFGVAAGDLDNDGYRDLIVTGIVGNPILLLRNQGNGTFSLVSNALPSNNVFTTSITLGDINRDGYLDVYVASYVYSSQLIYDNFNNVIGYAHDCSANLLFINNGNFTFTESASIYGLSDEGCAFAVAFTDFDNDNDVDLLIANDFGEWVLPSALYENQYPLSGFDNVSAEFQMDAEMYGMGIAIGDYDRDNDLDYYQTNIGRNFLSRNDGVIFEDVTTDANVENDSLNGLNTTSWGCFFFDADNDSWPDLFVANGQLPMAPFLANVTNDPNKLFLNNGDGSFSDISDNSGLSVTERSHGAICADFDKDGRVDIVVSNNGVEVGDTRVYYHRNISENVNHWVSFSLQGTQSNRDAIGARVTAWVNGTPLLAEINGGSSHASHSSTRIHFGLGSATIIDSVSVEFPSGISQTLYGLEVDQNHLVVENLPVGELERGSEDFGLYFELEEFGWSIHSAKDVLAQIDVFDVLGRLIWTSEERLVVGRNPFPNLPPRSSSVFVRVRTPYSSIVQHVVLLP